MQPDHEQVHAPRPTCPYCHAPLVATAIVAGPASLRCPRGCGLFTGFLSPPAALTAMPCPRCQREAGVWLPHASPPSGSLEHFRCGVCGHRWAVRRPTPAE